MELKHGLQPGAYNLAGVLIVPYGIETNHTTMEDHLLYSFNRTLWN